MAEQIIQVTIRTREEVLFQGQVRAISSFNKKGRFDILPIHAQFISLVDRTILLYEPNGNVREIQVDNGVLKVRANSVQVYVGVKGANTQGDRS